MSLYLAQTSPLQSSSPKPLSLVDAALTDSSSVSGTLSWMQFATPSMLILAILIAILLLLLSIQAIRRSLFRNQLAANPSLCAIKALAKTGLIKPFASPKLTSTASTHQLEGYLGEAVLIAYEQRCRNRPGS